MRPGACNLPVLKEDFSPGGKKSTGNEIKDRCFPSSIRADQTQDLPGLDIKAQVHHRGESPENPAQAFYGQDGWHDTSSFRFVPVKPFTQPTMPRGK